MRALALSGGGFRATLFHLGVIRRLAEEEKLKNIDVICSVSGGSILAAHLVMNWHLYCNSDPSSFEQAARPILDFVQRDVRGRVFRRWLFRRFMISLLSLVAFCWAFAFPRLFWWIAGAALLFLVIGFALGLGFDQWSRMSLLIEEYESGLYGKKTARRLLKNTPLWFWFGTVLVPVVVLSCAVAFPRFFWWLVGAASLLLVLGIRLSVWVQQRSRIRNMTLLPQLAGQGRPKLYILSTNLNTGDLCAFSDDGLHWWTEDAEKGPRPYGPGNVSVSEAVAASSSFPPAFPPFHLLRDRLGLGANKFPPVVLLTDGGVYDNSGVQGILRHCTDRGKETREGHEATEVIVSSAERAFDPIDTGLSWFRFLVYRAIRGNDIVMRRVSQYQVQEAERQNPATVTFRLADPVPGSKLREDVQKQVRNIRTDLNRFSLAEIQLLVYYGYLCGGGTKNASLPSAGKIELRDNVMPYVPDSAKQTRWLPFEADDMIKDPSKALEKSDSVKMFSVIDRPTMLWVLALLLLGGIAFVWLWAFSVPTSVSFDSVFTETPVDQFERRILEEINRDELLRMYKQSLVPEKQSPPRSLFFGVTKPLGDYCAGRNPRPFQCRVACDKRDCQIAVRLFVRKETDGKVTYHSLSPSESEPLQFSVPSTHADDRLVAIGRIDLPQQGSLGDLKKVIRLEVVK